MLIAQGRHYEKVFFGLNLYQLCETPKPYRNVQQFMQLRLSDYPRMLRINLAAQSPLQQYGQMLGLVSGAYGDRVFVQQRFSKRLWGRGRGGTYRWHRPAYKKPRKLWSCPYEPEDVALKLAYTDALLQDLAELADRSYLIVLPDRTFRRQKKYGERWARHRTALRELADRHPHVEYMELIEGGAREDAHFRDVVHLNGKGILLQRRLFERKLREAGVTLAGDREPKKQKKKRKRRRRRERTR